ncbi:MAG: hypothetical protein JWQ09_3921 [Segetibacter sp.]|nr:hypothetical protein [Segetibacter sp.]
MENGKRVFIIFNGFIYSPFAVISYTNSAVQKHAVGKAQYRFAVQGSDTTMLNQSTNAGYQKEPGRKR